jgi:hypothetical protein
MTATPEPALAPREAELQRRLGDLAARAAVDDAAWEQIQQRIAGEEPPATGRRQRPTGPRLVVAVAAAVVLVVVGIAVLARHAHDHGQVDTVDDTTTTTADHDGRSRTTTTTTTWTTLGPGDQPPGGVTGGGTASEDGAGSAGAGTGTGTGAASGAPGGGTATPAGGSGGAGPGSGPTATTTGTVPDADTAPDGRSPVVAMAMTSDVSVRATVWQDAGGFHMSLWQYKPWRHLRTWSWSDVPGQNCLAGATATFELPELAPFSSLQFSWGFVRADAADVGVITGPDDSYDDSARNLGPEVFPGIRPWLAQDMAVPVQRFRAISVNGTTLHYADPPAWDARPDTC